MTATRRIDVVDETRVDLTRRVLAWRPRSARSQMGFLTILVLSVVVLSPSEYATRICTLVLLYSVLAMGLNVVVGLAGLLDLGFIAFFGIGAYTYALLASPLHGIHVNFFLVLPLGMAVAATFGFLVGLPALRTHGDYLAIVTLAFGEIVYTLLVNLDRPVNITNGPQGVLEIDLPSLAGITIGKHDVYAGAFGLTTTMQFYLMFGVYALAVAFCCLRLPSSRLGRCWRAMRESEAATSSCGASIVRAKLSAFMFGAAVSGGAGVIAAAWYGSVFPDSFLFNESIRILSMVVLGGIGGFYGAIVGATVLVVLPETLRSFDQYRLLIFGVLLVLMMRFRPQGLIGSRITVRRARIPNGWTALFGPSRRGK
jgi:branched-chain amino acid transport system permease protein